MTTLFAVSFRALLVRKRVRSLFPGRSCFCLLKMLILFVCSIHEVVSHLGNTHIVLEGALVAANRCFPKAHPINALLKPHLEGTAYINWGAQDVSLFTRSVIVLLNSILKLCNSCTSCFFSFVHGAAEGGITQTKVRYNFVIFSVIFYLHAGARAVSMKRILFAPFISRVLLGHFLFRCRFAFCLHVHQLLIIPDGAVDRLQANKIEDSWDMCLTQVRFFIYSLRTVLLGVESLNLYNKRHRTRASAPC